MTLENLLNGLNQASSLIHADNKEKGFWDKERNVGELLMLITSELGEAMEAHRKGKFASFEEFEKNVRLGGSSEENFKHHIKDTFEDEIADSVIRLLDLSAGLGINLEKHILEKIKFNKSRQKLHGKNY